jgi:hypothetical protein
VATRGAFNCHARQQRNEAPGCPAASPDPHQTPNGETPSGETSSGETSSGLLAFGADRVSGLAVDRVVAHS